MASPASAVPLYFDLPRMHALCAGLGEAPPSRLSPWNGWEDFCRRAAHADQSGWRDALVSFVRWQGARDTLLIDGLRARGATGSLRRAWLSSLSRSEGVLFAGWVPVRASPDRRLNFTDRAGQPRQAIWLDDVATRSFTAVLAEPGLLTGNAVSRRHLGALHPERPTQMLLVGRVDRTRTIIPAFVAVGCG